MGLRKIGSILVAAAALTAAALPARAGMGEPVGVMDRPRPAYDAKGLPLGGFRLRPALDVGASHDDNVYRTSAAKVGDVFYTISPSFDLKSQWSRNLLELTGGLTRYQYNTRTSENRNDWYVGGNGRLDIARETAFSGEVSYNVLHEPRYSPDQPGGAAVPTQYAILRGGFTLSQQPNRFGYSLSGTYNRYRYDPTPLVGGGLFDNSARNRVQVRAAAAASVQFAPGTALFLRGSYDTRRFDTASGRARNSTGYRADVGAQMFLTHLVQGEIFIGFARQQYRAPFKSLSAVDYGAKLTWYATPLMTFHLNAARRFTDTTITGASVSDDQSLGLSLDYELLRDLILQARLDAVDSRFVGTPRRDKLFDAGLTAKYLINRYMSANAGYTWQRRTSTEPGQGFTDDLLQAGLHFQL